MILKSRAPALIRTLGHLSIAFLNDYGLAQRRTNENISLYPSLLKTNTIHQNRPSQNGPGIYTIQQ